MRIITLNTWGGRAGSDILLDFFDKQKDNTDIFCLQEMWSAPYQDYDGHIAGGLVINQKNVMTHGVQDISNILQEYVSYFRPHFMEDYGLMMLVSKKYKILKEGEIFVHKHKGYVPYGDIGRHARNIQYVTLEYNKKEITIINFHGLWNGKGKADTKERIDQSQKIIDFIGTLRGRVVLCGDFNLLPDTQSMQMFEDAGLKNLIKESGTESTRTSFYTQADKFADYILVNGEVKVSNFAVLSDEVSDHLPLLVDIE